MLACRADRAAIGARMPTVRLCMRHWMLMGAAVKRVRRRSLVHAGSEQRHRRKDVARQAADVSSSRRSWSAKVATSELPPFWNKVLEKAGLAQRLAAPHKAFIRKIGALAGTGCRPTAGS